MKSQCVEMLKACGGVEVVEKRNYNSQNKKLLPYFINRADQAMTGVSDFSAGVRTTFIYVILWGERLPNALRDVYYSTDFNELTDQTCNT